VIVFKGIFVIRRGLLAAAILACVSGATGLHAQHQGRALPPLPVVKDLATVAGAARDKRIPVLIAFTTRACPYCRIARRDHLEPMQANSKWRDQAIMLDMQLDTPDALIDFEGKATNVREFARRHGVRSVPTLIVFDADGKPASAPLVGLLGGDFYSAYIEQAMESGLIRMRYPQEAQPR
jgi:thioredoxin-related protein